MHGIIIKRIKSSKINTKHLGFMLIAFDHKRILKKLIVKQCCTQSLYLLSIQTFSLLPLLLLLTLCIAVESKGSTVEGRPTYRRTPVHRAFI